MYRNRILIETIYDLEVVRIRMDTIEIRLAKKEDAEFIALLGRTTFTETFGHLFRDQKDLIDYYNLTSFNSKN